MSVTQVVPGGKVTQAYGHNGHRGVDIGAPAGTPIYATHGGTVVRAGYDTNLPSFGYHVRIQAQDYLFIYGHMRQAPAVRVGQVVRAGAQLGVVGSTGTSTGNHCHYEVRNKAGQSINPAPFLGGATAGQVGQGIGTVAGSIIGGWFGGPLGQQAGSSAGGAVGQVGGVAVDAAGGVVSGLDTIAGFFGGLAQRATWVRVLQVVGGTVLLVGGVVIVGKGVIADVAVQAIPGGGVLKAAAGK